MKLTMEEEQADNVGCESERADDDDNHRVRHLCGEEKRRAKVSDRIRTMRGQGSRDKIGLRGGSGEGGRSGQTGHGEESLDALEENRKAQRQEEDSVDERTCEQARAGGRGRTSADAGENELIRSSLERREPSSPRISARCQPYEYLDVDEAVASRMAYKATTREMTSLMTG